MKIGNHFTNEKGEAQKICQRSHMQAFVLNGDLFFFCQPLLLPRALAIIHLFLCLSIRPSIPFSFCNMKGATALSPGLLKGMRFCKYRLLYPDQPNSLLGSSRPFFPPLFTLVSSLWCPSICQLWPSIFQLLRVENLTMIFPYLPWIQASLGSLFYPQRKSHMKTTNDLQPLFLKMEGSYELWRSGKSHGGLTFLWVLWVLLLAGAL